MASRDILVINPAVCAPEVTTALALSVVTKMFVRNNEKKRVACSKVATTDVPSAPPRTSNAGTVLTPNLKYVYDN